MSKDVKYGIWKSEIDVFALGKWSVGDQSIAGVGALPGLAERGKKKLESTNVVLN